MINSNKKKKLLLLIDMQNDFIHPQTGSLIVKDAINIIPQINKKMETFKQKNYIIAASKDWHPKNHISFASRHNKNLYDEIQLKNTKQILWPDHCIQNTGGAEFIHTLHSHLIDKIFYKGTDINTEMYSLLKDINQKENNEFIQFIQNNNFDEISVIGIALDFCVKHTILDLTQFHDNILIDLFCVKAVNENSTSFIINEFKKAGITIENNSY